MAVRKLSISVPAEVEETIKAAAAEEGKPVSAWLAEAATEKARAAAQYAAGRAAARELVAEYEAGHGPLPEASRQRARAPDLPGAEGPRHPPRRRAHRPGRWGGLCRLGHCRCRGRHRGRHRRPPPSASRHQRP